MYISGAVANDDNDHKMVMYFLPRFYVVQYSTQWADWWSRYIHTLPKLVQRKTSVGSDSV